MPQLGRNFGARPMHLIDHLFPAGQGLLAVEKGHVFIGPRRGVINVGALGNNQPGAALCTATVVGRHIVSGDIIGGKIARHRRHHDAIGQL